MWMRIPMKAPEDEITDIDTSDEETKEVAMPNGVDEEGECAADTWKHDTWHW